MIKCKFARGGTFLGKSEFARGGSFLVKYENVPPSKSHL